MKKTRLSTIFLLALTLLCGLFILASCGGRSANNTDESMSSTPVKLSSPTVVLTDDTAIWGADPVADKFEISIDGELSYIENIVTSKKLADGQTLKVRAIGDGVKYLDSDWSNAVTYTAPVVAEKYTVIWKNGDTVLERDENVVYGSTPSYDGATPTKDATAQYSYTFEGWTPALSSVVGDVTYSAEFKEAINSYTVTFYGDDGITILDTVTVDYGENAVYPKSAPVKNATEGYTYLFDKWVTVQEGNIEAELDNITNNKSVYIQRK